MNYNQNQKIAQITPSTLILGIDIAKDKHVARFQDDWGMEFGKRVFFDNRIHGFEFLLERLPAFKKMRGKRGRRRLRRAIYLAVRPLVANNPTFKALHAYYTKRSNRPLKKQQSLIACGKLLRVLFAIGKKQCEFDGNKLLKGLPQNELLQETA